MSNNEQEKVELLTSAFTQASSPDDEVRAKVEEHFPTARVATALVTGEKAI